VKSHLVSVVVGAFALARAASVGAQSTPDHLTCFRANDQAPKQRIAATLTFAGAARNCIVKTPAKLACLETIPTSLPAPGGGPTSTSSAGAFLCYQAKCPGALPGNSQMEDEFGRRAVTIRGAHWLCAPATWTPTGGTSPSPTTTTTLSTAECHFTSGHCEGSCAGGGHCAATAASGTCECRSTPCGNADAPQCDGFCQDDSEACVFSVTGCSCARIP